MSYLIDDIRAAADVILAETTAGANTKTRVHDLADQIANALPQQKAYVSWWNPLGIGNDDSSKLQAAIDYAEDNQLELVTDAQVCLRDHIWSTGSLDYSWEGAGEWVWDDNFNDNCSHPRRPLWVASTAYVVGNHVENGGDWYVCTVGGTSAGSGGPSGTGSGIVDGTVTWDHDPTGTTQHLNTYAVTFGATAHLADGGSLSIYTGHLKNPKLRVTSSARLQNGLYFANFQDVKITHGDWDFSAQGTGLKNQERPRFLQTNNNSTWHASGATEERFQLLHCTGEGTSEWPGAGGAGNEGFSFTGVTDVTVHDCEVKNAGDDPIAFHYCDRFVCSDNRIRAFVPRILADGSTDGKIINNDQRFVADGLGQWGGSSHFVTCGTVSSAHTEARRILIKGNTWVIPSTLRANHTGVVSEGGKDIVMNDNTIIHDSVDFQFTVIDLQNKTIGGWTLNEEGDGTALSKRITCRNNPVLGEGYSVVKLTDTTTTGPILIEECTASRFQASNAMRVFRRNHPSTTMREWVASFADGYEVDSFVRHEKKIYKRSAAKVVPEAGTFSAGDWIYQGNAFRSLHPYNYDDKVTFGGTVTAVTSGTLTNLLTLGGLESWASPDYSGRILGALVRMSATPAGSDLDLHVFTNLIENVPVRAAATDQTPLLLTYYNQNDAEFAAGDKLSMQIEEGAGFSGSVEVEVELLLAFD